MNKKLTKKDQNDWKKFTDSKEKIEDKDKNNLENKKIFIEKTIDLHGYTLNDANIAVKNLIEKSYLEGVSKINIITGKGKRSTNDHNPYLSSNLSILKYSVPEYIKNNQDLMKKIKKINFEEIENSNQGSFDILLKKNNK